MAWNPPSANWQTAETPFTTSTGVLRLTILDNDNIPNNTREVTVGDLLMSRDAKPIDRGLIAPGGLMLGRRTADFLPDSFSSRVLSRSHAQFLIGTDGRIYVADLGSMHGTTVKRQGVGEGAGARLATHAAAQLHDGDLLTLGKSVEAKTGNHNPLRLRVSLRFPNGSPAARPTGTTGEFASKDHLAQLANSLGLTSPEVRRRGYGLDESVLYESEPEDPLPRGTPQRAAPLELDDDDVVQLLDTTPLDDDGSSVVFLSQSSPTKTKTVAHVDLRSPSPSPPAAAVTFSEALAKVLEATKPEPIDSTDTGPCPCPSDDEVESYPIKFIPSSFPTEDHAASVAGSDHQEFVMSDEEDADKDNDVVDAAEDQPLENSVVKGFSDDEEYPEEYPDEVRAWDENDWDLEVEHEDDAFEAEPNPYASSDEGSCSSFFGRRGSVHEYDSEEIHDHSGSESNSDSESDSDSAMDEDEDSHLDSDDGSHLDSDAESTNPVIDESPEELHWRSQNIFNFTAPSQSLPVAAATEAAELVPATVEEHEEEADSKPERSESAFAVFNSFPPSPPLSTGAESSEDNLHAQAIKDLNSMIAAARTSTKRSFDEVDSNEGNEEEAPCAVAAAVTTVATVATITSAAATMDAGTNPNPVAAEPAAVVTPAPTADRPSKVRRLVKNASFVAMGIAIGSIGTIAGLLQMAD